MILAIDPPSGWKYGFPKKWDEDKDEDLMEWIVIQGYPQSLINEYGDYFYIRSWRTE